MKSLLMFFVLLTIAAKSQSKIFDYSENDFDDNKKIYETISYINSEMKNYDLKLINNITLKPY